MTKEIQMLRHRINESLENYRSLRDEELYVFYKKENGKLSQDQLDYLMCQALCCIPNYTQKSSEGTTWLFLKLIRKIIDCDDALDPQLAIISQVVAKRKSLDICDNWCKSVVMVYELVLKINAHNLLADAQLHEHLMYQESYKKIQEDYIAPKPLQHPQPVVFTREPSSEDECCNWLTKDFTAPLFW